MTTERKDNTFKDYLLKLVDDSLPEDKKKKNKKKSKEERDADLPTGILKYLQISNAGDR